MKNVIYVWLIFLAFTSTTANAQFEGSLVLEPTDCIQMGKCVLKEKLRFTDSAKLPWEAAVGLETDGASIPPLFQIFIGTPFETAFIKAAILHDHYCKRFVRTWQATHKMFYEGLLDQGVPQVKAKLMYYAVYLAGPKWAEVDLVPGNSCGGTCINTVNAARKTSTLKIRPEDYKSFNLSQELASLESELIKDPTSISLLQLEQRALSKRPSDEYYLNRHKVEVNDNTK